MTDHPRVLLPVRIERIDLPDGPVADSSALAQCLALRRSVFVFEQSVPPELEWDGLDAAAEHFAAYSDAATDEGLLGTARLRFLDDYAKAERVAVRPSARRHGIGRRLMQAIEVRARERGCRAIRLNAQVAVVRFYEGLGYVGHGARFLEAGIEHLAMSRTLD